jgi:hypothetical protein
MTVAAEFGVGYSTLIHHLTHSLRYLRTSKANELLKWTPQRIRREILGSDSGRALIPLDQHWLAKTLDVEVGTEVMLPKGSLPDGNLLEPVTDSLPW